MVNYSSWALLIAYYFSNVDDDHIAYTGILPQNNLYYIHR